MSKTKEELRNERIKKFSVSFSKVGYEYKYNPATDSIDIVDEYDIQERINSNMVEPLEILFDKFSGIDTEVKKQLSVNTSRIDRLNVALRSLQELDTIREECKLPLGTSHEEILKHIQEKGDKLQNEINLIKNSLNVDKNKGVEEDEKKTIEQEK